MSLSPTERQYANERLTAYLCAHGGHTVSRIDPKTGAKLPAGVSFGNRLTLVPDEIIDLVAAVHA